MTSINWLHLTDLHMGKKDPDSMWPSVKSSFFKDLREDMKERAKALDVVFFTGDLTQSGSEEEFEELGTQLNDIRDELANRHGAHPLNRQLPALVRSRREEPPAVMTACAGAFEECAIGLVRSLSPKRRCKHREREKYHPLCSVHHVSCSG